LSHGSLIVSSIACLTSSTPHTIATPDYKQLFQSDARTALAARTNPPVFEWQLNRVLYRLLDIFQATHATA
jgi:hypothetical protein